MVVYWFVAFPMTSNHALVLAVMSAALLVLLALKRHDLDGWRRAVPDAAAGIAALTYGMAVVQKLNTAYLDPEVSCAVVLWQELLVPVGPLEALIPIVSLGIEASLIVLILVRKTRYVGFLGAMAFHTFLGSGIGSPIYLFSITMAALFLAALSSEVEIKAPPATARRVAAVVLAVCMIGLLVRPIELWRMLLQLVWLGFTFAALLWVVQSKENPRVGIASGWPELPWWLILASIMPMLLNTASAHLGWKTANSFDMYANLVTRPGQGNHLFLPAPESEADWARPITIVDSDIALFKLAVGTGLQIPALEVDRALGGDPAGFVRYRDAGAEHTWQTGEPPPFGMDARRLKLARFNWYSDPPGQCVSCLKCLQDE